MRILIYGINFSPELTGVGKYTGEMAEWLAARGHSVRVVTAPPHYPHWEVSNDYSPWRYRREQWGSAGRSGSTISVLRCPLWVPRAPRGWRRVLHLASFALTTVPPMLEQILWQPEIVLVIEPAFLCAPLALFVARLCGAPAWLHVQDFELDAAFKLGDLSNAPARRWAQAVERLLMRRFDRVSAISDRMVERLAGKGVDPSRAIIFRNWVDTSAIHPLAGPSPWREKLGIPNPAVVALYSGSMGKKQGLELLAEASQRLASRPDIHFIFCGDGAYRETLEKSCEVSPNVLFLPLQPPELLNNLLAMADIHLLPQRAGAADLVMPSKLTGMLASGRAILATADHGTQLAAELEGRGMVTPPGDIDAFVSALLRLADDGSLRRRMGRNARKYAVDHMDREKILSRFEGSLLAACGQSFAQAEESARGVPVGEFQHLGRLEFPVVVEKK
ncbi:MAG TPA: glycosyltransferase WbuB [Candidatus Limnocylindria bacterium]|nr:glycosyltransferase WbuB [Candidatus Limnocylindria bacterium]